MLQWFSAQFQPTCRRKQTQSRGPHLVLPRQERSSQTGNHGTTPPYGRELLPGRTRIRKGEVHSNSLFRVFRWIPWLISDPPGAAIGCCWTESAVRICADLGCRGNMLSPEALTRDGSDPQWSSARSLIFINEPTKS